MEDLGYMKARSIIENEFGNEPGVMQSYADEGAEYIFNRIDYYATRSLSEYTIEMNMLAQAFACEKLNTQSYEVYNELAELTGDRFLSEYFRKGKRGQCRTAPRKRKQHGSYQVGASAHGR